MSDDTSRLDITRIDGGKTERVRDVVSRELPVKIMLNDTEIVTLMCSPKDLDYLAVGFLFAEGLIGGKRDIRAIEADEREGTVRVETGDDGPPTEGFVAGRLITTSGGRGVTSTDIVEGMRSLKSDSQLRMSSDSALSLMRGFLTRSKAFELTGAAHSSALCSAEGILVFREDIGRHNAIDKVVGESILKDISTDDRILVISGRISAEIVIKAARCGTPIMISKSAPTDLAVRLAAEAHITLVGFARGQRMNVYSSMWRITT
jgi:FdhD protein